MLWLYGAGTASGSKSYGLRAEAAHDEAVALERLVHRRRLMHPSDDRLEVVDVERPRVEVPVPSDHIERMVIEDDLVEAVVLLHQDREVALLVVSAELRRPTDVPLAVRSTLDQLAELVPIPLGPAHVAAAFHHQQLRLLAAEIQAPAMQDAPVNDEVVAFPIRQVAEHRLQRSGTLADVHQLVGLCVPVEVRVVFVRLDVEHRDVLIEEERHAVERRAAALLHLRGPEVPVPQRLVGIRLVLQLPQPPRRLDRGRRMHVVEQARRSR